MSGPGYAAVVEAGPMNRACLLAGWPTTEASSNDLPLAHPVRETGLTGLDLATYRIAVTHPPHPN